VRRVRGAEIMPEIFDFESGVHDDTLVREWSGTAEAIVGLRWVGGGGIRIVPKGGVPRGNHEDVPSD
jgi:hypothetical protein